MQISEDQYSLKKILCIWAIVTVPMPLLAFVVAPMLADKYEWTYGITVWVLLIFGMIWQFIVSVFILSQELKEFSWPALKERLWLNKPRHPKTGRRRYILFLWLIPAMMFYAVFEMTPLQGMIGELILVPFPFVASLPELNVQDLISPDYIGAWWLMVIAVVSCVFNYLLGEELLFRGVLLPKMRGVFGRWDFAANSALFALYHLHRPTMMLAFIFGGLAYSFPSRYFKSNWFAVILHGLEGIPLLIGVFAVVSGLYFQA